MTAPTRAIFKPFTQDSLKVKSEYEELYDKSDIDTTYRKINVINFDQELEYNGIKVKCYCAGHVLGAAMFQVEIDGVKVLYTGDYSTEKESGINFWQKKTYSKNGKRIKIQRYDLQNCESH
ncbi:hypothetical protein PPERSA_12521 [Pseudocohnilembus persalinus]|uniref:Metallo-beta-lactamase domain-containing protein n=1 Tax=Pseudocohnilembus persalinus TaxID=266149 RepID=A0A0V0QB12_PSEPJ|nr:hypothetical protein PPERSA_12521 [Pseudocohnilembus persalinus]|eukprot:KRW99417.1 hypothetical protein PPERSA_12521 [Pseudocohnilembus persalinus]